MGGAPIPPPSPQSSHLRTATATAMALIVLYVKREHYSGKPPPSPQSSHLCTATATAMAPIVLYVKREHYYCSQSSYLFVLQSLGGATNGGANTIDITIPVIKVKLPLLNPQPSPFFATQRQQLHQCHCLHHYMGSS